MKIPCPVCVPCQDPTEPFLNFSAEDPDVDHQFCYGSGNASLLPGPGRNYNVGMCNVVWGPITCYTTSDESCLACVESTKWTCNPYQFPPVDFPGLCDNVPAACVHTVPRSCISMVKLCGMGYGFACQLYDDTAKCVAATPCFIYPESCIVCPEIPAQCEDDHKQCPSIPEQCYENTSESPIIPNDKDAEIQPVFWNAPQGAATGCPDGTLVAFFCLGHRFAAYTQALANEKAASYAVQQLYARICCLSELLQSQGCKDQPFNSAIQLTGRTVNTASNRWSIVAGQLPPGLELNRGRPYGGPIAPIMGTPTEAGAFTFRVRAVSIKGDSIERTYTICVIGITPEALPDAPANTPYSETLTATGCANPTLSWQVFSGTLPNGLLLDEETGVISGTPDTPGTYDFMIRLQTEST